MLNKYSKKSNPTMQDAKNVLKIHRMYFFNTGAHFTFFFAQKNHFLWSVF